MFWRLSTLLFAIAAFCGSAYAGPLNGAAISGNLRAELGNDVIIKVRGCHSNAQTHYVPRLRRTTRHYHSGRNCQPRLVRVRRRHCHTNAQTHYIPQLRRTARHYHSGRRCRAQVVRVRPRHCHSSFSRHYHAQLGWKWHRHVGRYCNPTQGRSFRSKRRPRGRRDCVQIGPLWICQ